MVFVDSNVILDVITADPIWQSWSEEQLSRWLDRAPVLINPIVYAEIAFTCEAIETVDELLPAHLGRKLIAAVGTARASSQLRRKLSRIV